MIGIIEISDSRREYIDQDTYYFESYRLHIDVRVRMNYWQTNENSEFHGWCFLFLFFGDLRKDYIVELFDSIHDACILVILVLYVS